MENSGAKAALKGYRLQTLYILNEILLAQDTNLMFQPEGQEDLAIYSGDNLTCVIQVKARAEALALSSFAPEKKDSFFHRVTSCLENYPKLKAKVVCFGKIGPEIQSAWAGEENSQQAIRGKLAKYRIPETKSELLFKRLCWEIVSETDLLDKIKAALQKTVTSGNAEHAISLLTSWLYFASEKKSKISHSNLIKKIASIGEYFSQREAHHQEWYRAITPLYDVHSVDVEALSREFYQGISTRFNHIQANLDVKRSELLDKLDHFLQEHKTVILYGASGQGKSALAYRYLNDYVPEEWRFLVRNIENRWHAQTIALAITGHLAAFEMPVYVYMEVSSRDSEWPQLVSSLLDCTNVKIIISIRAEDLARQEVPDDEIGFPALLPIQFTKEDAIQIYESLDPIDQKRMFPSAEQAWLAFGGRGALLEFIYFLTQTESLETRLKFQVKRIRIEIQKGQLERNIMDLLLSCAIATAFESRVRVNLLTNALDIRDPVGALSILEEEYLIRVSEDRQYIEALHPIRSKILSEIIIDREFNPVSDALKMLTCSLHESDLHSFLLNLLALYPEEADIVFTELIQTPPRTWCGLSGVCRAMLWRGIAQHVQNNKEVIEEARAYMGTRAWRILVLPDVTGLRTEDLSANVIKVFERTIPELGKKIAELNSKVSPTQAIFDYLAAWLKSIACDVNKPEMANDWFGMGEVLSWVAFLKLTVDWDLTWLSEIKIENDFSEIKPLAIMLNGLYEFDGELYEQFILKHRFSIEKLFQVSTNTVKIESLSKNPIAHYIIPIDYIKKYGNSELNELTCDRARLLKNIFPGHKKYGAKGYGHQTPVIELPIDESNKPGILADALPPEQFVAINSTWSNFADYVVRPENWNAYIEEIIAIREEAASGLVQLNRALKTYFKNKFLKIIFGKKINEDYWKSLAKSYTKIPLLPKIAVDPWGITSESSINDPTNIRNTRKTINLLAIQSLYQPHIKALNNYASSLSNFFNQSHQIIIANNFIGRKPKTEKSLIIENLKEAGIDYSEHLIHLTVTNLNDAQNYLEDMQVEFRKQFASIIDAKSLQLVESREKIAFEKIWPLWYQFAHNPELVWKGNPQGEAVSRLKNCKSKLFKKIVFELKAISSSKLEANIIDEDYRHEGRTALWIQIDVHDLTIIDDLLTIVVDALATAIRPLSVKELNYFTLINAWEDIVIVPTINGKTLSNLCWVLFSASFAGDEPVLNEEEPWLHLPRFLEKADLHYLNLEYNPFGFEKQLVELKTELGLMAEIIGHMHSFAELIGDLSEVGELVLEDYLSNLLIDLKTHIEKIVHICDDFESDDEKLKLLIEDCRSAALPYEVSDGDTISIQLSDCADWFSMLFSAITSLQNYNFKMLEAL